MKTTLPLPGGNFFQFELFDIAEIVSSDANNIDLLLSINWRRNHRWSLVQKYHIDSPYGSPLNAGSPTSHGSMLDAIRYECTRDTNRFAGIFDNVYEYLFSNHTGGKNSTYVNLILYSSELKSSDYKEINWDAW